MTNLVLLAIFGVPWWAAVAAIFALLVFVFLAVVNAAHRGVTGKNFWEGE